MAGNCGFLTYFGADGTGSAALPTAVSASKRERGIEIRGIARAGIRITHVPQSWRSACPDRSVREDGSDNDAYVKCASPAGRIWAHSLTSISSPSWRSWHGLQRHRKRPEKALVTCRRCHVAICPQQGRLASVGQFQLALPHNLNTPPKRKKPPRRAAFAV